MMPQASKPKPSPDDWGERIFETVATGQHYRLSVPAIDVVFDLDRLRRDRGDLKGHLTVRSGLAGARTIEGGILLSTSIYLASAEARARLARMLEERASANDIDFVGLLEELTARTEAAERRGEPAVRMAAVPLVNADDEVFDVHGLRLPKRHPTMLYGLGDSFKSYILAMILGELELRGERTMLIDYEMTAEDHRRRLAQLYGAKVPNFLYVRAERPLTVEIDRLLRMVHDERIKFVAIDSVGFGCSGPPEHAEEALAFMRAVRRLNTGTLLLAHQAKGENGDKTPFGSAFWFNSARSIYHVKREQASLDGRAEQVALYPTKSNLGRRGAPVGLEFTFGDDEVTVKRRDVADMGGDLAASLSVPQRMRAILKRGPMSVADVAEELGVSPNTVAVAVTRGTNGDRRWLTKVPTADGTYRIGLLAK